MRQDDIKSKDKLSPTKDKRKTVNLNLKEDSGSNIDSESNDNVSKLKSTRSKAPKSKMSNRVIRHATALLQNMDIFKDDETKAQERKTEFLKWL